MGKIKLKIERELGMHMSFESYHTRTTKNTIIHKTHELNGSIFYMLTKTEKIDMFSYGKSTFRFFWEGSGYKPVAKIKTLFKQKGYDINDFE